MYISYGREFTMDSRKGTITYLDAPEKPEPLNMQVVHTKDQPAPGKGQLPPMTDDKTPGRSDYALVQKYGAIAGVITEEVGISNHTFRASGITTYLENGGALERAQRMANHASPRTTQLYDRREDVVELEELERVRI